ncbi:TPA: DUF551 domain-containing protein [Enterobacter roggenkampii]
MITFTKEQLIASAHARIEFAEMMLAGELEPLKERTWSIELELARIALASLEAVPVGTFKKGPCGYHPSFHEDAVPLYTAPPAPVYVPAAMEMDDDFDSSFEHGKAVGWNACRAAMLQGADGTLIGEGTITATQFKPVADLYGLTSPTGGETSFTFDAVEARDFIDGGWSCQEYVELGRFQEVMLQNGNSPAQDGNYPVVPDGWVACSERMPETMVSVLVTGTWFHHSVAFWDGLSWCDLDFEQPVTHWMPLPAAPQQEVKP